MRRRGLPAKMIVGRLGGLEPDVAGQADELIRAGPADQGRVPEPAVLAGRPTAAGEVVDHAVAAVDGRRQLHAGIDDDVVLGLAAAEDDDPVDGRRSPGWVVSSWPLTLTWMTLRRGRGIGDLGDVDRVRSVIGARQRRGSTSAGPINLDRPGVCRPRP